MIMGIFALVDGRQKSMAGTGGNDAGDFTGRGPGDEAPERGE